MTNSHFEINTRLAVLLALAGGPKMTKLVWKGVNIQVFRYSCQFLLNKFFDSRTPSMRKVNDGGKKLETWKNNCGNSFHKHSGQSTAWMVDNCNANHLCQKTGLFHIYKAKLLILLILIIFC